MSFNNWEEVTLEEVVDVIGDGLHGTPKYDENGDYYFINGNNLNGNIIIDDKTKKVGEEEYFKYRKDLNDRTILVSINGTLGKIAVYNGEKIILGKSACYFNVKKNNSKEFVKYVMYSDKFKHYLHTYSTGTTIKNMGLKQMRAFRFYLPPIEEQKAIAKILSDLDDKIEVNNKINKRLEEMAQAIFKQWFVDFEFPNEEGKPYKSSGGEMVESELGIIPKGWMIKNIEDLTEVVSKGTTPTTKDMKEALDGKNINFLKVKDISDDGLINIENIEKIPMSIHLGKLKRSILKNKDILFSIAGTIGRLSYVNKDILECNINQAIAFIRLNDIEKYFLLVYYSLKVDRVKETLESKIVQGVQQNLSLTVIKGIKIIIPQEIYLIKYNKLVNNLFNQIENINYQNNKLKQLRDTLLPKLMSGEIRVPH